MCASKNSPIRQSLLLWAAAIVFAGAHLGSAQISIVPVSSFEYSKASDGALGGIGNINDAGGFVGRVSFPTTAEGFHGDVSRRSLSKPFTVGTDNPGYTVPWGINNSNLVCGSYLDGSVLKAFFLHGDQFRSYAAPVAHVTQTYALAVNDQGDFVGSYLVDETSFFAYANIGRTFINIPLPGTDPDATGINNLGQVVGSYGDSDTSNYHAFFRDVDGNLTLPIDFPGATETVPESINDAGFIAGVWSDFFQQHGFVIQLPNTFISFDMAGARGTVLTGINNNGMICGYSTDAKDNLRGLIAQLQGQ